MAKSNSAMGPRGRAAGVFTEKRREAGTTLVEILVVIVIFLIGILAVVQIFPRGFALLLTTRNNSAATALGRDQVERLKDSPDLIPDEIVPIYYSNGMPVVDTTLDPTALGPQGNGINAQGQLLRGSVVAADDWMLASGPNVARRIVGEGHRLTAPRVIGTIGTGIQQYENYGSLLVLDHGPAGIKSPLVAYANDLSRTFEAPRDAEVLTGATATVSAVSDNSASVTLMSADGSTVVGNIPGFALKDPDGVAPYEFFVVNAGTSDAAIFLPATRTIARSYRVRMSAYLGTTPTALKRYDYLSQCIRVPAITNATYALVRVRLADILGNTKEAMDGLSAYAVDPSSVQVSPQYLNLSNSATDLGKWTEDANGVPLDPFQMKVVDANLGVLLFSPAGRGVVVQRPGGTNEPLVARIDYDVRDWRIIAEDFRVVDANSATFALSLQSVKVGSNAGPDGLPNGGLFTTQRALADSSPIDPTPSPRDNVVILDLTTGFEVQRYRTALTDSSGRTLADQPNGGLDPSQVLVSVDKSRGSLTFHDANVGNTNAAGIDPLDVLLIPPFGGAPISVNAANRTFRVLYRARQEWSVQILKGASRYIVLNSLPDPSNFGTDQCFVGDGTGGTYANRIYFPSSEAGHKITIDRIVYRNGSNPPQILEGQDFVLQRGRDVTSFAYADLSQAVVGNFDSTYGTPVQGVKGASVSVRVLWNPDAFTLSGDPATNLERANVWGRSWRKSTTETYLRPEETR